MSSDINILEAVAVKKSYKTGTNSVEVLKGIDVSIVKGSTTALVGASGAGKSTLLHLLGALDRPSSGSVLFEGVDIFKKNDAELADFRNKSIGFVFQFHHLLPEFSAVENVAMPALVSRINRDKAYKLAEELLSEVGLSHRFSHRPGELSGGEQQRVAIARGLVLSPKLLLADEPTGNLDMKTSEEIHSLLIDMQKRIGLTLVVVTHNENLAAAMENKVHLVDGMLG